MLKQGYGKIINTASMASLIGEWRFSLCRVGLLLYTDMQQLHIPANVC